ncbi:MAG: hypothetical protein K2V38_17605 [Gemmataceae bacterium]|nr:hypothetical protein [Gemmataceae bacterium]
MRRGVWAGSVLVLVAAGTPVAAQPLAPLEPLAPLAPVAPVAPGAPGAPGGFDGTPVARTPTAARPPSVLGAPVRVEDSALPASPVPVSYAEPVAERRPQKGAAFGRPTAAVSFGTPGADAAPTPVPTAAVDSAVARTAYNPPAVDPVQDFLTKRSERKDEKLPEPKTGGRAAWKFGDSFDMIFGHRNGEWFRSDHGYDNFISPVSNPFLAEDPRSLTELRPVFIYQKVPGDQRDFRGGNISFFGAQARLALSDRWSLVFHKLGGISVNPGGGSRFASDTGFAELWVGPKYTFYRGEENGALVAGGLQFQLPVGSKAAFQDTGTLSLAPYVTYGQNFFRESRFGSFNSIITTGYSFSTNNQRSDYLWLTGHLDFNVLNLRRFYPLAELNWVLNTSSGRALTIGSEGRDLINFGGQAKHGLLTGALGGRFVLTQNAQFGAAFEIPFAGPKDFFRYRFTLDFILRY